MAKQSVGTTKGAEEKFSVVIRKTVFIPDIDALRQFAKDLKTDFDANPNLKVEFKNDPQAFLANRGVAIDLQREILTEAGMEGSEFGCFILSCILSDGCIFSGDTVLPL